MSRYDNKVKDKAYTNEKFIKHTHDVSKVLPFIGPWPIRRPSMSDYI